MAYRTVSRVLLDCDLCGYTYGEDDDGPWLCAGRTLARPLTGCPDWQSTSEESSR